MAPKWIETRNHIVKKAKLWLHTLLLSACLITGSVLPVQAAEQDGTQQAPAPESGNAQEAPAPDPNAPPESYNWEVQSDSYPSWPKGPLVAAETAILMDLDSGQILYAKGIDEKRYPASTTKIMTALLAIENKPLTDQITFTNEVNNIEPGSTHIGIKPGEILTMEQSLYAILLASANEVSSGVAESIGGSVSQFADMMNQRASEIGCENTHFVNANGLHDDNHYTTARDLALIAREAFKNETFRKITGTEYFIVPKTNITDEERWLNNHHKMLVSGDLHYDGCVGGKTGYTERAGNTLVTFAQRDGMSLVAVVLADNSIYQYSDTASLLDYGFTSFRKTVLAEKGTSQNLNPLPLEYYLYGMTEPKMSIHYLDTLSVDLPADLTLNDLTRKSVVENKVRTTDYYLGDMLLARGRADVVPGYSISSLLSGAETSPAGLARAALDGSDSDITSARRTPKTSSSSLEEFFQELKYNFQSLPRWKYPALILIAAAVIFYIILLVIKIKRHRKKRRQKKNKNSRKH